MAEGKRSELSQETVEGKYGNLHSYPLRPLKRKISENAISRIESAREQ
jgi:hypothetical protein